MPSLHPGTALPTLPRDPGTLPAPRPPRDTGLDVSEAGRASQPLTGPAVVDVCLAVAPRVARLAVAAVAAVGVLAGGARTAWALHALIDVNLTGLPWRGRAGSRWLSRCPRAPSCRPPRAGPPPPQDNPLGVSGEEGDLQRAAPPTLEPSGRQTFKPGRALQPTGSSPNDGGSLTRDALSPKASPTPSPTPWAHPASSWPPSLSKPPPTSMPLPPRLTLPACGPRASPRLPMSHYSLGSPCQPVAPKPLQASHPHPPAP